MTTDQENHHPRGRELFDAIRKRPPLYLGTRSLTALANFMHGYDHALFALSITSEARLSPSLEFHDWTAYRLHFQESTSGWHRMILERTGSESLVLDRFFELFDEFESRQARVVAKLADYKKQYVEVSGKSEIARSYPSPLLLLTYTDDPGFFISTENPQEHFPGKGFCYSLDRLLSRFSIGLSDLEILDSAAFDRCAAPTIRQ